METLTNEIFSAESNHSELCKAHEANKSLGPGWGFITWQTQDALGRHTSQYSLKPLIYLLLLFLNSGLFKHYSL